MKFLQLGQYGIYVWPAFIFTFVSCFYLYLITKKKFHKYEKLFISEFEKSKYINIRASKKSKTIEEILSGSSI